MSDKAEKDFKEYYQSIEKLQEGGPMLGASLRDYFAAKVMASWIIAAPRLDGESADSRSTLAEQSYAMADAMLAARSA